jgi:hypothetical protein
MPARTTLGVLLVVSHVGATAAYPCSSDADCQYVGCNDFPCSGGSPTVCVNGYLLAYCKPWGTDSLVCSPDLGPSPCPAPVACPAGTFSGTGKNEAANGACRPCVAGKYSQLSGAVGPSSCTDCVAGKYAAETASTVCTNCDAGKYSGAVADLTCGGTNCFSGCTPSSGASSGTITDGAGNYANNANCWWLLATSPGAEIRISFESVSFDTTTQIVTTYQCSSASCSPQTEIMSESGSLSASNVYTSTTGFLKVTFKADGYGTRSGFTGTWSLVHHGSTACDNCVLGKYSPRAGSSVCTDCVAGKYKAAVADLTCGKARGYYAGCSGCTPSSGASSGTITDGAGNYANNANCWWLLATSPGVEIRISFPWFDTHPWHDYVTIYQCSSASCLPQTPIMSESGSLSASNVYTSTTGFLKVTFTSVHGATPVTHSGFTGTWSLVLHHGSTACDNCVTGKYSPPGESQCTDCVAGKYSLTAGASHCTDCVTGKYSLTAGASQCTDCADAKYSPSFSCETQPTTSATTTSSSTSTYAVRITLSLPMSQSAFTKDKQTAFKSSLAQATGVASEAVVINKIESISSRRHLLVEAIRVETSIMAADTTAAEEIAGRLTADSINRELFKSGLPTASVLYLNPSITSPELSDTNTGSGSDAAVFQSSHTPVLVGGILGLVVLAGLVACFCRWKCNNHSKTTGGGQQLPQMLQMGEHGPPTGLPNGWQACIDQAGNTYYQNQITQQTQLEHPSRSTMDNGVQSESKRLEQAQNDLRMNDHEWMLCVMHDHEWTMCVLHDYECRRLLTGTTWSDLEVSTGVFKQIQEAGETIECSEDQNGRV